jgi:hypothetical protein
VYRALSGQLLFRAVICLAQTDLAGYEIVEDDLKALDASTALRNLAWHGFAINKRDDVSSKVLVLRKDWQNSLNSRAYLPFTVLLFIRMMKDIIMRTNIE